MVLAVAKALEDGARSVICASTGNTSASAAAYAAAAGLECVVVLPAGKIAVGKLLQALVFGARVISVRGNFDEALRVVRALSEQDEHPITLVNSVNPFRLEGQKTAAFEVVRRPRPGAGRARDPGRQRGQHLAPTGAASASTARPGASTPSRACGASRPPAPRRSSAGRPVDHPETVATAIRIGNPASWTLAIAARDESGGRIDAVTDDEILAAHRDVARLEGVFCEPSSAASLAGVAKAARAGELDRRRDRRVRADRQRAQGPDDRGGRDHGRGGRGGRQRRRRRAGRSAGGEPGAAAGGPVPGRPSSGAGSPSRSRRRRPTSGAGYDCLGLALDLVNHVAGRGRATATARSSSRSCGEGAFELPSTAGEPVRRGPRGGARGGASGPRPAAHRLADRDGQRHPALARSGLVGRGDRRRGGRRRRARELAGATRPDDDALLQIASTIESHPDNAAAVLLGGFVVSAQLADRVAAIRFDAPDGLRCVLYIPDRRLATEDMRGVLPEQVPLRHAVENLGRVAVGVAGIADGPARAARRPDHRPAPRAVPLGGLPGAPAADAGRARGGGARGVPVGRRVDDPGVRRAGRRDRTHRGGVPRRGRRVRPGRAGRRGRAPQPRGGRRRGLTPARPQAIGFVIVAHSTSVPSGIVTVRRSISRKP